MSFEIKFYGRDYTEISKDISRAKAVKDNKEVELDEDAKLRILKLFLDTIKDEFSSVVANQREGRSKKKIKLFEDNSGDYKFDGFVGVISKTITMNKFEVFGNAEAESWEEEKIKVILQIQSRFDTMDDEEFKPFFLVTMLKSYFDIKTVTTVPSNEEDFFYFLLIIMFKNQVIEAYQKGYYKTYHRFEENNDRIKGSIDIARHIKLNMGMENGKVAYSYREHTVNNYLNHLIIEAFSYLKKKYSDYVYEMIETERDFGKILDQLKYDIGYPLYSPNLLASKNLNPLSHPYFTEYEQLRKICLKVLRDEGVSPFEDSMGSEVEGFLFYIPDLWEIYLQKNMTLNHCTVKGQEEIKVFDYGNSRTYEGSTYPDFVFCDGDKPFMILDAKFKPAWGETISKKKSISGYLLDDYTKCIRDMNSINGHATGTIFPTSEEAIRIEDSRMESQLKEFCSHNISKYNWFDKFYTIPVYVLPTKGLSYEEWKSSFEETLYTAMTLLNGCVNSECKYANRISTAYNLFGRMEDM